MTDIPVPYNRSYWAIPGMLLAGCYPGAKYPVEAEDRMKSFLDAGIRVFINLMEDNERDAYGGQFEPYIPFAERIAEEMNIHVEMKRMPISDMGIPTEALMDQIISEIDNSLDDNKPVYIHCLGGRGRTGTTICCYLLERRLTDHSSVLDSIKFMRRNVVLPGPSPESRVQLNFVNNWKKPSAL